MRHLARNTMIAGILELAESCGVSPDEILSEAGLDPAMAQGVGMLVPSEAIIDATEFAALRSGRSDFGLLLGSRQDHRLMGPLGLLFEQSSTINELQAFSRRFFHLHNTALNYSLTRRRSGGAMQLQIRARGAYEPRHYVEALFVICVRMARIILGPKWRPVAVHFRHQRLAGRAAYERYFGATVRFGQNANEMLCTNADFKKRVEPRDAELKQRLEALLHELDSKFANDITAKVSHLIRALLPAGQASVDHVAKLMSLTPRTLQRRLRMYRLTFSDVLATTRVEMAREYLRGGVTITQMAPILGFSEASAVSRFLRERAGMNASDLKVSRHKVSARSRTSQRASP